MPDEPRPSVLRRAVEWRPHARLSMVVALVATAVLGAVSAVAPTGASGEPAPSPVAAVVGSPDNASLLGSFDLLPSLSSSDADLLAAMQQWVNIAALPTATA